MTDNLKGLQLRKALAPLLGWEIGQTTDDSRLWFARERGSGTTFHDAIFENLMHFVPHWESDPAISEQTLDAECKKRGWLWSVDGIIQPVEWPAEIPKLNIGTFYSCEIRGHGRRVNADASTPSEARALALYRALTSQPGGEK